MEKTSKKPKVLIVDDEPINIFFLEGILSEEGLEVCTASDGMDALSKVTEFKPDVIMLDIMMPGMSGIEVLEKVIANPEICHIPVIGVGSRNGKFYTLRIN